MARRDFCSRGILSCLRAKPAARARIEGGSAYPNLRGSVEFYACGRGTAVLAEVWGLPTEPGPCEPNVFAFHIHANGECSGEKDMDFSGAGGHYNPENCPHPAHSGDLPPLFGNRGYAWLSFYTERFIPIQIIGKAVIIHARRDDFFSQPAGDAGERIACGVIKAVR